MEDSDKDSDSQLDMILGSYALAFLGRVGHWSVLQHHGLSNRLLSDVTHIDLLLKGIWDDRYSGPYRNLIASIKNQIYFVRDVILHNEPVSTSQFVAHLDVIKNDLTDNYLRISQMSESDYQRVRMEIEVHVMMRDLLAPLPSVESGGL